MSDRIKVFFLEPTDMERRWLRRYSKFEKERRCGNNANYFCNGMTLLYDCPEAQLWADYDKSNPQWPNNCDRCGVAFEADDEYQLFKRHLFKRQDTGELFTLADAPPGACWDASWMISDWNRDKRGSGYHVGPDGRCLVVKTPDGHDWMVDARCSNCTLPDDDEHFCWVRHGRPEDGTLHVDKNGKTCSAGAGSIATGKWHGFLHNGYLHT